MPYQTSVNPWQEIISNALKDQSAGPVGKNVRNENAMQDNESDNSLRNMLQVKKVDQEGDLAKISATHTADLDSQQKAIERAQALQEQYNSQNPGHKSNVAVSKEGVSINQADAQPNIVGDLRRQAQEDKSSADLSKRYEKLGGFQSALQEIEDKTNKDGQGGVLTNPGAKLSSTGGIKSAVPTQLLGLGEMFGAVDKGTSDERKSLERLQLEYQKAMSGMRVTDQARAQERQAMGWIASGDPALVAKGVRSLSRNVGNTTKIIQSGYTPEVRDRVHSVMGDPMDMYGRTYNDNVHPTAGAAPQGGPAGGAAAPEQAQTKTVGGNTYVRTPQGWVQQ